MAQLSCSLLRGEREAIRFLSLLQVFSCSSKDEVPAVRKIRKNSHFRENPKTLNMALDGRVFAQSDISGRDLDFRFSDFSGIFGG
jgi:hypothetical protein